MQLFMPTVFTPKRRCYFTPVLWTAQSASEEERVEEWRMVREHFAQARQGRFGTLDSLVLAFPAMDGPDTRGFAVSLLGDAGTDSQLERIQRYVVDEVVNLTSACDLCHSLGLWGRLSAVDAIFTAYDRWFPGDDANGLPAYLTTMLEAEFGPAADYPREDTVEAMETYEAGLRALQAQRLAELGGPTAYAFFGERFSVRRVAERMLSMLGRSRYEKMMRPYLRQRFEASTGIDCSDFYQDGEFRPLTTAAKLEAWLASDAPDAYEEGERYFFGHKIPRGT